MRRWIAVACLLVLPACAVPHERGDLALEKTAAQQGEVTEIFQRYTEVRSAAAELLDAKPLSTVEAGAVLAIDTGSFEVSQRLAKSQEGGGDSFDIADVQTPRFAKYPIWFYAVVRDETRDVNRVQIFERASAVDPWFLVATPEALAETKLPDLRSKGGAPITVEPDDGVGMSMSAADAAAAYVKTLGDPKAPEAATIENDSFIKQMRQAAATNGDLPNVSYSQAWDTDKVQYVLRTSDGGALAFVTLLRSDTYEVEDGLTITWPDDTPQQAFLSSGIAGAGTLNYYHQVLLHIPGGKGKPRALGQYGGVVSADATGSAAR